MIPNIDKITNFTLSNQSNDLLFVCDEHAQKISELVKKTFNEIIENNIFLKELFENDSDINLSSPYRITFSSLSITIEQENKSKSLTFSNLNLCNSDQKKIKSKCIYALEEINAIYRNCHSNKTSPSISQFDAPSRKNAPQFRKGSKIPFQARKTGNPSYRPRTNSNYFLKKQKPIPRRISTNSPPIGDSVSKAHMHLSPTHSVHELDSSTSRQLSSADSYVPVVPNSVSHTSEILVSPSYQTTKSLDLLTTLIEMANEFEKITDKTDVDRLKQQVIEKAKQAPDLQESIFYNLYILNKKKNNLPEPTNESERFLLGQYYFADEEYNNVKTTNLDRALSLRLYVLQEMANHLLVKGKAIEREILKIYELLPQDIKNSVEGHLWQLDGCNKKQDPLYGFKAFRELEGFTSDTNKKSRALSKTLIELISK
jgi:hypothetical protein